MYSKCLTVSVFDGLEMDLVSYSMKLLQDNDASQVLGGSKILRAFVEQDQFRGDTLRRIGVAPGLLFCPRTENHQLTPINLQLNTLSGVSLIVTGSENLPHKCHYVTHSAGVTTLCVHLSICAQLHIYTLLDHTINPSGSGLELFYVIGRFGPFMTALGHSEQVTHHKCCQNSSTFIRLCLLDMN